MRNDARHFPSGKCDLRLLTPVQVGIGVQAGEFKAPERPVYERMSEARGGNFTRAYTGFTGYRHAQQQAKLIIPTFQTDSRIEGQTFEQALYQSAQSTAALALMDMAERRRLSILRETRALVQRPDLAKAVTQKLQASCSSPELSRPFGDRSSHALLMNRRFDVNRMKKCRAQMAQKVQLQTTRKLSNNSSDLDTLSKAILSFEAEKMPCGSDAFIETSVDWKNSTQLKASFQV